MDTSGQFWGCPEVTTSRGSPKRKGTWNQNQQCAESPDSQSPQLVLTSAPPSLAEASSGPGIPLSDCSPRSGAAKRVTLGGVQGCLT